MQQKICFVTVCRACPLHACLPGESSRNTEADIFSAFWTPLQASGGIEHLSIGVAAIVVAPLAANLRPRSRCACPLARACPLACTRVDTCAERTVRVCNGRPRPRALKHTASRLSTAPCLSMCTYPYPAWPSSDKPSAYGTHCFPVPFIRLGLS